MYHIIHYLNQISRNNLLELLKLLKQFVRYDGH